jgi:uncharacterized protein YbjT (DUF2867 family)
MQVAVVGGTGQIGSYTLAALRRLGHGGRSISQSTRVDVYAGTGLLDALVDMDAVIDVLNNRSQDESEVVDFFTTTTRNLLEAERAAGVRHHVLLSVVGIDNGQRVAHYSGKREQERLVESGATPWTIVRSTQFYELPGRVAASAASDGVAKIAPLLVQPIAPSDVADILVEIAVGDPLNERIDIAGPETHDFVDLARRTLAARGQEIVLEPTWRGLFDTSMAGEVLLPGPDPRIAPTTFDEWLAATVEIA